jgi:hypothetical protein
MPREAAAHLRALGARPLLDELLAIAACAVGVVEPSRRPTADRYGLTGRELEVLDSSPRAVELADRRRVFITRKTAASTSRTSSPNSASRVAEAAAMLTATDLGLPRPGRSPVAGSEVPGAAKTRLQPDARGAA